MENRATATTRTLPIATECCKQFVSQLTLLFCTFILLSGCASLSEKGKWGGDTRLLPGWSTVKTAAYRAATDRKTWIPVAGAALVYATDQDERITSWASDNEPIFRGSANERSTDIRDAATYVYALSVLSTPSGDSTTEWLYNKTKGILVGSVTYGIVSETTDTLKESVGRTRPDGDNTRSFISGHTSSTATNIAMAMRNTEFIDMPEERRRALNYGMYSITLASAWSRVEANVHYPSDVLVSMALGNFVASFMNDAFLEPVDHNGRLSAHYDRDSYLLNYQYPF